MNILQAGSVYAGIECILDHGWVAAAYRRACLLETATGELITLAAPELGNGPNAILVGLPAGFAGWPPGAHFFPCGSHRLCFEHGPIVEWGNASRWSAGDSAPLGPPAYDNADALAASLRSYNLREGLLPVVLGERPATSIQQALAAKAAPAIAALPNPAAARQLAGLGPGSTPSGDDLLAGLLLTLHYAGHPAATALRATVLRARTTRLGRAILAWAGRGEAREHTLALLRSLFSLPAPQALKALGPVLQYGATSGADQCAGILIGLRLLRGDRSL